MAATEDELRELKQRNNDLAQKVQYWKMLAGQREKEKLKLMKEINELRLKLSRVRSNGNVQANNLKAALQSTAQKALAHLVRASGEIATTMELAKTYTTDREELDDSSPRWSSMGNSPSAAKDKVNRVPPLMLGGQSIQPVVALTMLDTSNARSASRNSNANRSVTERAVPMHMLQDVYIPLTRIDLDQQAQNMETEETNNTEDSAELIQLDDNEEERVMEESQEVDEDDDFDSSRILDAVSEETEPENEEETPQRKNKRVDNPLEGPSWMLDVSANSSQPSAPKSRVNLEPDSTTELEDFMQAARDQRTRTEENTLLPARAARLSREFSPTVRRRKRASSPPPPATPRRAPHYSPRARPSTCSTTGRVLKVLVSKMRLDGGEAPDHSPPKRASLAASHAPSPNGATVAGVIVSEANQNDIEMASGEPSPHPHRHRRHAHDSDSDWSDTEHINIRNKRTHTSKPIDAHMEQLHINTDRRIKRELDSPDSRERNEERNDTDNKDFTVEIQINKERMNSRGRGQSAERQIASSVERTERRYKPASERDRSNDRLERSDSRASNDSRMEETSRGSACGRGSCDSDSGSGGERDARTRRTRKVVTYKEKPLNRKMRR